MQTSFIFITTLLALTSLTTASKLQCKKLFKDKYQLFYYHSAEADTIEKRTTVTVGNMHNLQGTLHTSICGSVKIPKGCENAGDTAKLVFISDNNEKCIMINESENWGYELDINHEQSQVVSIKQQDEQEYKIMYNFVCEAEQNKREYKSLYMPNEKIFEIKIISNDGCGIHLDFFKVLSDNSLIAAIAFTIIGLILCFFGLKFYRDFLMFFIPLLTLILGFYFYMSLIEKSASQNERILLIFFMVFGIMVLLTLAVLFSSVIYFVICLLSSYQLGLTAHAYLITQFEFFTHEHTEWIPVAVFFILLFGLYLKLQDYFIIINTAVLGSFSLVISLPYYGLTSFDFLFNIEMDKFDNIKELDPAYLNMLGLFSMTALLGILVQYGLFKRGSGRKYRDQELKIDLKLTP